MKRLRARRLVWGILVLVSILTLATRLLDRPYPWIAADAHRPPAVPVIAAPAPRSEPESTVAVTAAPVPPSEPVASPPPIPPAVAGPQLRTWIIGDSMCQMFGPRLRDRLVRAGLVESRVFARAATGLARPDFFDWPAKVRDVQAEWDPQVVVVLLGTNDGQPLLDEQGYALPGTERHEAVYRARVRAFLADLVRRGARVYWIGLPAMRSPSLDRNLQGIERAVTAVASEYPGVRYVPTRDLFSDGDGRYAEVLPDSGGTPRRLRTPDGIHLTFRGTDRLVDHAWTILERELGLNPQPTVAGAPQGSDSAR